jgi:hypothetical protein
MTVVVLLVPKEMIMAQAALVGLAAAKFAKEKCNAAMLAALRAAELQRRARVKRLHEQMQRWWTQTRAAQQQWKSRSCPQ